MSLVPNMLDFLIPTQVLAGIIDNGLLLLFAVLGFEFDKYLVPKKWSSGAAGAVVGAVLGNSISDWAAFLPAGLGSAFSILIGCLIPLLAIPFVLPFLKRREAQEKAEAALENYEELKA